VIIDAEAKEVEAGDYIIDYVKVVDVFYHKKGEVTFLLENGKVLRQPLESTLTIRPKDR
jgi:hypothetical protein